MSWTLNYVIREWRHIMEYWQQYSFKDCGQFDYVCFVRKLSSGNTTMSARKIAVSMFYLRRTRRARLFYLLIVHCTFE